MVVKPYHGSREEVVSLVDGVLPDPLPPAVLEELKYPANVAMAADKQFKPFDTAAILTKMTEVNKSSAHIEDRKKKELKYPRAKNHKLRVKKLAALRVCSLRAMNHMLMTSKNSLGLLERPVILFQARFVEHFFFSC